MAKIKIVKKSSPQVVVKNFVSEKKSEELVKIFNKVKAEQFDPSIPESKQRHLR